MRRSRFVFGCLILMLAGVSAIGFVLSAPPADPDPPGGSGEALAAQWAALADLPAGASFEIDAAPSEWAGWLNAQIVSAEHAPFAGVSVRADDGQVWLEARLRGILLVPTRLLLGLSVAPAADGPGFSLDALTVGRLHLPAPLCARLSARLNAAWRQWAGQWQIEKIELSAAHIRIVGRRR